MRVKSRQKTIDRELNLPFSKIVTDGHLTIGIWAKMTHFGDRKLTGNSVLGHPKQETLCYFGTPKWAQSPLESANLIGIWSELRPPRIGNR